MSFIGKSPGFFARWAIALAATAFASGPARAAEPVELSARLLDSGYTLHVMAWRDGTETAPDEFAWGGTVFVSLDGARGERMESSRVGNHDLDRNLITASGDRYEIIVGYGAALRSEGGLEGMLAALGHFGIHAEKPDRIVPDHNLVVVLVDAHGEVRLVDTALAALTSGRPGRGL